MAGGRSVMVERGCTPDASFPEKKRDSAGFGRTAFAPIAYAQLQVTTNFTFLTGASHPEEFVRRAAQLGYRGIAVTDRHSLAGIVRAHIVAKEVGLPFAVGCRLELEGCGLPLAVLVYPTDRLSYGRLCQLLTLGQRRAPKGKCRLTLHDLIEYQAGLLAVLVPPTTITDDFVKTTQGLCGIFCDDRISLAVRFDHGPDDRGQVARWARLAHHLGIPLVATHNVHYHSSDRKPLHDVLACIRHRCTLQEAGFRLSANAERDLKPPHEIIRLFTGYPEAVARSVEIIERASAFSLDQLCYEYPHETCPSGRLPMQHLTDLTWHGAVERYPNGIPSKVKAKLRHELKLIDQLNYPHYFLTVHDIVRFAKSREILCQGRGAAANSAVCYCLGVTAVDPDRIDLLFERFVSKERNEPPDIDIDFEHERREEVIQYIYAKYGRHRAALTAQVITYRARSAVRQVGKALGLSLDCVDRLAKDLFWFDKSVAQPDCLRQLGINPDDPTIQQLVRISTEILGFPRHLSQHVGGFVLTEYPLSQTVPIENAAMPDRTVIQWDKDDIDALGMLKVDVLGLGMLTCVRKCFQLIRDHHGKHYEMYTVPAEDPHVYDMICRADTIGVFQIESRAQMSMLPRLRPRHFYDLVIEVAIVRPGPIQGQMVHPYLRRRNKEEPVDYPSQAVRVVLEKTLGVPLFQEQAMSLAIKAAGFTPGQADRLRRAMAAWKRKGDLIYEFGRKIIDGMLANGYTHSFAQRCFDQIKGFSEYGFPESHAASFALIVYVSAWLKHHYPVEFAAALINSQPMGFYAPAQIVRDAKEHRVEVRSVDVNHSAWDCTLEPVLSQTRIALRLGMRLIKGLGPDEADAITSARRQHGFFVSIKSLWRASGVKIKSLRALARADAFGSIGLDRQQALWMIRQMHNESLPLFDRHREPEGCDHTPLPIIPESAKVVQDYASTGLSLKAHPVWFLRGRLSRLGVVPNAQLQDEVRWSSGAPIAVAGVTLVRQRPGTASGIVFMTIEDETGVANLILRKKVFDRNRHAARHGVVVLARGRVERQGQVVHVMVRSICTVTDADQGLGVRSRDFH